MVDLATIVPTAGLASIATWGGNALLQYWRSRDERREKQTEAEIQVEQHRDGLTFDLLKAARSEIAFLTETVSELRRLGIPVEDFEQALAHLDALLAAETPEERRASERQARAFLNRMRRVAAARGTVANEIQLKRSLDSLPEDMREQLKKLD